MSDIYRVELFKEKNFQRKECSNCGRVFWTLDPERETCGDTPCDEYNFMDNPPIKKDYTLPEMEEEFLSFFEENDHSRISRYPVVARWRDDIFLTIASIADFQPWVTSGEVPPPANPLVVSQPSIRLNDIDNVGRSGRHFTLFFMGGHHAFNKNNNQVYWTDETVDLCHNFLTDSLGIDPLEITYIQDFWEGGGNAGEDFEVNVGGLELATLVFMQYEMKNGQRKELPLKIVDTGYGMERLVWASQGTPSSYEAIFGPVVSRLRDLGGVEMPPESILKEHSRLAGLMDIESGRDLNSLRKKVSEVTGRSIEELDELLVPLESIYAIADHLRCLAFMLGDGITPSNAGEGYLARLVLRRTLRLMRDLGFQESLTELMNIELDHLAPDFPQIKNYKSYILEVLELEEEKYRDTLKRGERRINRLASSLKEKGEDSLSTEKLIELYDSHGLPPEVVKEISEDEGIKTKVPEDFYIQVAEMHSSPEEKEEEEISVAVSKLEDLPPTELLYYKEPYRREFDAEVLRRVGEYVVLDKTSFYPEGGGQPSDKGVLEGKTQDYVVEDTQKAGDYVLHKVNPSTLRAGQKVTGKIDWNKRISLMRHHTATHILLGAARKLLGDHVWQHGVQKGVERSRLDVTHFKRISSEELKEIENLANKIVFENRDVNARWMDRNKAEEKYGHSLYQGGVVPGEEIRVVSIEDWNAQACAGTHCERTGEVGLIKITGRERLQDGVERLEFASGESIVKAIQEQEERLDEASRILRTSPDQVHQAAEQIYNQWKDSRKEAEELRERLAKLQAENLINEAEKIGDIHLISKIIESANSDELISIGEEITKRNKDAVVLLGTRNDSASFVAMAGEKAIELGIDCGEIAQEAAEILGGGGGGQDNVGQGGGTRVKKLEDAMNKAIEASKNQQEG
ncbi:MAG: alanine--tRNA ligase [Hadesarchaea archaeon]|nr:alanine--tRNA ligase [Hadesarchaea archaeon]